MRIPDGAKIEDVEPSTLDTAPPNSEEALALAFATRHADQLRYVAKWGKWFIWDGRCWCEDETRKVFSLARALCREAAARINKGNSRKTIASAKTRAAVVALAGEDRRLVATVDQWDADPWLLNTPDGVIDLRNGKMQPHRITDYMTKMTAVSPGGDCPSWKKFMGEITDGDTELQRYHQRVSGYCLTGDTREQQLFFFYGTGNNGKGVWVLTVSRILDRYHTSTSIETFTTSRFDRHPTELAKLSGARLVTAAETEEGRRWSEARIKELTGGDKVDARWMRQDWFSYYPQFKLLFLGNHMPTLRAVNKAITRRFNRIPFAVTIADDKVNKNLADDLREEWPGILAWMIEGCLEWQRIGLCPPQAVTDATDLYLEDQDVIGEWLEECCEKGNDWVSATDLFNSWKPWAEERQEWVGSVKSFRGKLEDRGLTPRRNKERTKRGFAGLRIKEPASVGKVLLWLFIQNETPPRDGHDGAVLVSLNVDGAGIWLPKSKTKLGEQRKSDGRTEVTIPIDLAKAKGLLDGAKKRADAGDSPPGANGGSGTDMGHADPKLDPPPRDFPF